jgi:SAM-dependent methyltransferase
LIEFTGERVLPGHVDADLWNEHLARYTFAARLATDRRVLDAGCGTGYGSAELAQTAQSVTAFDIAEDAISYARQFYARPNLTFLQASGASLPLAGGAFDLAVAFEVIEHVPDWQAFLRELHRVLTPAGQLVISTPNKDYYADTRRQTGPNPYHIHEFTFDEFAAELAKLFPFTRLYLENHAEVIAFAPVGLSSPLPPELSQAPRTADPASAHFFLAVCSSAPLPDAPAFLYAPATANVLREREIHIDKLEIDVHRLREEKQSLVEMFRSQTAELDRSNRWARDLDEKLAAAQQRIVQLQDEVSEMSQWAQRLDAQLNTVHASRWFKLGNRLGLGPVLDQ